MALVNGLEDGLIFGAIGYEIAAKASQYVPGPTLPTWTHISRRHQTVGLTLVVALAWHFRPLED